MEKVRCILCIIALVLLIIVLIHDLVRGMRCSHSCKSKTSKQQKPLKVQHKEDYNAKTYTELKKIASKKGLKGYYKMSKAELAKALSDKEDK